ncbi:kelch repeat-containing protein [Melittangium boletus]|uniref:kelch repeat-containing protein n=1 Tax=Melittangium boletus TaxID=83453 RepID=UPI003DA3DAAF
MVDASGKPVPGAALSTQGAVVSLDGSGHRLFENLPPGRFFARVDAPGFASSTVTVELQAGAHVGSRVMLLPLSDSIAFEAEQGGALQTEQVLVHLPPNAVVDALGQPVTGPVTLTVAPLDPTHQLAAMPGPLEGRSAEADATVQLESLFMAEVSLWSGGAPAQLAPGKTATLEFLLPEALASRYAEGELIPAWWFDLDAGHWREEGLGSIEASSTHPGRKVWLASVKHFTWWNADAPWTDKSCVDVRVVDGKGAPVKNIEVNAWGVSYSGTSSAAFTEASGQACVEIKRGSTVTLLAGFSGQPLSERVTVTAGSDAATCGGGACTPVRLVLPEVICTPGASVACAYSGPGGTENQGVCRASRRWCDVSGTSWSACVGEVLPATEDCFTPFDDDCDGVVNEDCRCSDKQGQPCYGGPGGTEGVGLCRAGVIACDMFGTVTCQGQRLPEPDLCWTSADEDCDGANTVCGTGPSGWSRTNPMMEPESSGWPFLLPDGKVLLAGSVVQTYNPATNVWRKLGPGAGLPQVLGAALLSNGKVLFVGAEKARVYDLSTNTWSDTGSMNASYQSHLTTAMPLANGKAIVAGITSSADGACGGLLSQVYEPIENTWGSPACMRQGHYYALCTATLLAPHGTLLIDDSYRTELYDQATNSWRDLSMALPYQMGRAVTARINGNAFFSGGWGQDTVKHSVHEFDPSTNTWTSLAPMLAPRQSHILAPLADGRVLALGGQVSGWPYPDNPPESEIYDPRLNTWSPIASANCELSWSKSILLPNGTVFFAQACSGAALMYTP